MVSKSVDYAVRALIFIARSKRGSHSKSGGYVGVRQISENIDVSPSYLGKILQKLTRAGFLVSITGPGGGFALRQTPDKINLLELIHCLEGEVIENDCFLKFDSCSSDNPCPIHSTWKKLRPQILRSLSKTTIATAAQKSWPYFS